MHALERIPATRVAADPAALDAIEQSHDSLTLRLASDDLLIIPPDPSVEVQDEHAIVDGEGGFSGAWFTEADIEMLQSKSEWRFPTERPAFAQGLVAGVPVKLAFTDDGVLVLAASIISTYLEERIG